MQLELFETKKVTQTDNYFLASEKLGIEIFLTHKIN
jgi:hypothetical protein